MRPHPGARCDAINRQTVCCPWPTGGVLGSLSVALTLVAWSLFASAAQAELRFANIFDDNIVVQQEQTVRVWGWAKPGAEVAVTITEDANVADPILRARDEEDQTRKKSAQRIVRMSYLEENVEPFKNQSLRATAGADGQWLAEFDPMKASFHPKFIIARSGDEAIVLKNVLIGEVWVCSGQSNMAWRNFDAKDLVLPGAMRSGIRHARFHQTWHKPLDDLRSRARWRPCSPETAGEFSAVPLIFSMCLHDYLKVPVGIINNARGGTLGLTWTSREALESIDNTIIKEILRKYDEETAKWESEEGRKAIMGEWQAKCEDVKAKWEKDAAQAKAEGKKPPRLRLPPEPSDPRSGWSPPAGMFNAVVHPIGRMAIRGVLYYQGENQNFGQWTQYEFTFPAVISSFRRAFGDDDLPFGIITLAGWGDYYAEPETCLADGYAIVRDVHTRTHERTPNTGLITTHDVGWGGYIHPGWKRPIGERAARWALAKVYGKKIRHRGPAFKSMKIEGRKALLTFTPDPYAPAGKAWWQIVPMTFDGTRNPEYRGFIIAGKDRRWYKAKAKADYRKGVIEVWSDLVDEPVAVRYGWRQFPDANACDNLRLPVPPFRTDDWPLPEMANYSKEVEQACKETIGKLRSQGEIHALHRKIGEAVRELASLEWALYMGRYMRDPKGLLRSKISRVRQILGEFEETNVKGLCSKNPEIATKTANLRDALKELEAAIEDLPERGK